MQTEHAKLYHAKISCSTVYSSVSFSPRPYPAFQRSHEKWMTLYAMAREWRFTWNWPAIDLIIHVVCGSKSCFLAYLLFICVFQSLEVRFRNKVRSINKPESHQRLFHILVVMCCHIPGPPAFLVNVGSWEWPGDKAIAQLLETLMLV